MQRKSVIVIGVTAAAVLGAGTAATHALSGTTSTTGLDQQSTVTVDGQKALAANLVAGRIQSRYRPLPWVGSKVTGVSCPGGLKAVAGTTMACTAKTDGRQLKIPVRVIKADSASITWKFDR